MPTNVPPQYREAEQRFRDASSIQGKIAALQEMLQIMPKHKGTDHLKAQLRSRLSKLMGDLETSSGGKGGRTEPFSLPKEGAGRVTLIGDTNVGKSLITSSATGARTKVGAYELSTQEPVPGMYPYLDIYIQMKHLLHFLLLILTLLDLLYYNLIFTYLILGLQELFYI